MELYLEVSQCGAKASRRGEVYKLQAWKEGSGQLLILHASSFSLCALSARPFKPPIYKWSLRTLIGDKDSIQPAYFH